MPQEKIDTFRASLKRCLADDGFLNSFYEAFVGSSEEVREKFKNTDMKRQVQMLEDSLYVLAVAVQGGPGSPARGALSGIARKHSHAELDIQPGLYDLWLSALIQTVEKFDSDYSAEIEAAWRDTLAGGIEYMRSHY